MVYSSVYVYIEMIYCIINEKLHPNQFSNKKLIFSEAKISGF